jgi:predicted dehydrogenase
MDDTRVLIVGFGAMGRFHLKTLRPRPGTRVVGVVRRSTDAAEPGLPVFTRLADGLALAPDVAIVSTPHHLHHEQAAACLEAGCHVLVEKPLALHYADAVGLAALARQRGRYLVVGLQRRYEGLCRVFRDAVADGSLGEVRFVHGFFAHRFSPDHLRGWRLEAADAGAGILDDSALHLIDLVLVFAGGSVTSVDARVLEGSGVAVPHSFAALLDCDSGATVSAAGSYLSPSSSVQEEISILGTRGSLFARRFCKEWNADPPTVFYKSADGRVSRDHDMAAHPVGKALPLLALLDVLQGRAGEETLLTSADRVLETHRVVELVRTTARRVVRG